MRSACGVIVTAVAVVLAWGSIAAAQVLQQVPADALVLVKVTNARQVSDKVAKLARTLGVAQFQPGLNDPLNFIKTQLGVTKGLNENGDIAFVLVDPTVGEAGRSQSVVVLVPVGDYEQFLGNFEGAQQDGAVTQARIQGRDSFIAQWGDYAALSPTRELVAARPQATIQVAGLSVQELEKRDIILYANMEKLRATVLPELQKARPQMLQRIEQRMGEDEQQQAYMPTAKVVAEQALNVLEGFFRDASGATIGLSLEEGGISTAAMAEFADGSYAARKIQALKPTGEPLIRGLPKGEYLMLAGMAFNGKELVGALDDFAGPVLAELDKVQTPETGKVRGFVDSLRTYLAAMTGQSGGLQSTNGQLGAGPLFKQVTITRGDAEAVAKATLTMMNSTKELTAILPQQAGPQTSFIVNPDAKTVEEVEFDEIVGTIAGDPQTPEAMQMQQFVGFIYGPEGMKSYQGVVGDAALMLTGVSDEGMAEVIAAVKRNDASVVEQPHVQSVTRALPQQRIAEMYIQLDNWVRAVSHYAGQFNMPIQVQLPPDLPPIGIAIATDGNAIRVNSYVPTDLVQSLIAAGMQAFIAAQGGAGGM